MGIARGGKHGIQVKRHARPAHVPQHKHLGLRQHVEIHLRGLLYGRAFGKRAAVHAGDNVIQPVRHAFKEVGRRLALGIGDTVVARDIHSKQMPVKRHDVSLCTAEQHHAILFTRPDVHVEKILEVADVLLGKKHVAKVIGRPQHLQARIARGCQVFHNGRVRMARKQRMGMDVARYLIGHSSSFFTLDTLSHSQHMLKADAAQSQAAAKHK